MRLFRVHLATAGLLLCTEIWLGVGLLGMGVGVVIAITVLVRAITHREQRFRLLRLLAIYVSLCIATAGLLTLNLRVAQRRAIPVVSAIERFHSERGRYPDALDELVPRYLPLIPNAGFTLLSRHFGYLASRPQLYFPAMFHGIVAYDFPSRSWRTNE